MRYEFKYKKGFFWKTIKNVKGHQMMIEANRMDIFLDNGIISISNWSQYDMKLGQDFLLVQKEDMEKEAGTDIRVSGVKA